MAQLGFWAPRSNPIKDRNCSAKQTAAGRPTDGVPRAALRRQCRPSSIRGAGCANLLRISYLAHCADILHDRSGCEWIRDLVLHGVRQHSKR